LQAQVQENMNKLLKKKCHQEAVQNLDPGPGLVQGREGTLVAVSILALPCQAEDAMLVLEMLQSLENASEFLG